MSDDLSARDAKLMQYLNEAYEKELETALQAHTRRSAITSRSRRSRKAVGDKETEKLARDFRRQEERMAAFLVKLLPQLAKAVATEDSVSHRLHASAAR